MAIRRHTAAVAAAAAVAVAGCTGRPYSIDSLRIEGDSAIPEDALRKAVGSCASAVDCASDLESHYFDQGYITATVQPTESILQKITSSYSSLTVKEGPRYTFGTIEIVEIGRAPGDELGDPARLAPLATVRAGDPFLRDDLAATFTAVQRHYTQAGYPDVLVIPVTDVDSGASSVDVRIEVVRGPTSPFAR